MTSSSPPIQAVILAGGRGTRLAPLTDTIPKPLVPIQGRPFLSYHLDQLREQGFENVIVLVGYLAKQIKDFCGDGSQWGLDITCVESPLEAETGQRIRDAAHHLNDTFLLMYCDNYWPMQLPRMWSEFQNSCALASVTVFANRDGYSRSNMRVDEQGMVREYDPSRKAAGLNGVEIGYALMPRDVLKRLPEGNVSFEHTVFPALAAEGLLNGQLTEHRYYSVGSHERLPLTESFMAPSRMVILDRDGVVNKRPAQADYVKNWGEFQWLPGAVEALQLLKQAGYKVALVTNQPGIARKVMNQEDLDDVHARMQSELSAADAGIDEIYFCPHGWDDGCFCRKPSPGMLFQAQRDYHLDLTKTLFIGDDERDMEAGEAAGCLTSQVTEERSLLVIVKQFLQQEGSWAISKEVQPHHD